MDKYRIENLEENHIDEISEIEKQCFSSPWSQESIKGELTNLLAVWFVAMEKQTVAGYVGMHHVLDEGYINNVATKQEYRAQGVATKLLKKLIEYGHKNHMKFISLEVRISNVGAIKMYSNQGFKSVGIRKNFYSNPTEDAMIMTNEI